MVHLSSLTPLWPTQHLDRRIDRNRGGRGGGRDKQERPDKGTFLDDKINQFKLLRAELFTADMTYFVPGNIPLTYCMWFVFWGRWGELGGVDIMPMDLLSTCGAS